MHGSRRPRVVACLSLLVLAGSAAAVASAWPAAAPAPITDRVAVAENVFRGRVLDVYRSEHRRGSTIRTEFVVAILVDEVVKGTGTRAGHVAYARAHTVRDTEPEGRPTFVGSTGHEWIPAAGARVTTYAAHGHRSLRTPPPGELTVLLPNGFELIKTSASPAGG